jgi:hypothetical protein
MYMLTAEQVAANENAELVRPFYSPKYTAPHQVSLITAISKERLINLINTGAIKAKRFNAGTVLIEIDSVIRYIESLPDVVPETTDTAAQHHVTYDSAMKSYKAEYRKAMDLFSEAQPK